MANSLPLDHGGPIDRAFEVFPDCALERSIIDRFDAIVRRFGYRLAIKDTSVSFTYAELAALVDRIAAATAGATEGRAGPVALLLPADAQFPAAMLGVLAAGHAYVPLDADFPIARNELIVSAAGACAIISSGDLAAEARTLFPRDIPVIDIAAMSKTAQSKPSTRPGPDDLAYIIYTSGSTGTPKGVFQNHRNHLHDILQYTNALHLTCEDRLSLLYSPSVAGANRDIYGALLNGASLHILPPRELKPAGLVREFCARGLTIYHSVPALFRHFVGALDTEERLESVRLAYLAGDRIDWSDVDAFRRGFSPRALLYVAMGSTECAVAHSHWFVEDEIRATSARLPVGRPVSDKKVTIVDPHGRSVPKGDIGELVVTSRYIALGYWRAPDLTASAFGVDPNDPECRLFRTGDLVRQRPDGLIEFVGRKDQQIKLRGHRIELAEIESTLRGCLGVSDAAVVVRSTDAGIPHSLVAYVVIRPGISGLLPRHFQSMLAQRLPHHMIPASIILLDELPRLPNFKIDRCGLAQMDTARLIAVHEHSNDPLINEIICIFKAVVGVSGATPDDTIASIGGDSLQTVNILAELERRYAITIPDDLMGERRTIRSIARWIKSQRAHSAPILSPAR